jgi:hypothetical protein
MALRRAVARLRRVAGREASSLGAALPIRHVRYGSLADISERIWYVRFTPESGHAERYPGITFGPLQGPSRRLAARAA